MLVNIKPSEQTALLGVIAPISQGVGTVTSGWCTMQTFDKILAVISTGVLGAAGTVDAKIQQAQDSSGTGVKDVAGKAITQLVVASNNNNQALINVNAQDLDVTNSFDYVRLSLTVGGAASLVAGALLGFSARFDPASDSNPATVVQVV